MQRTPLYNGHYFEVPKVSAVDSCKITQIGDCGNDEKQFIYILLLLAIFFHVIWENLAGFIYLFIYIYFRYHYFMLCDQFLYANIQTTRKLRKDFSGVTGHFISEKVET